MNADGSSGENPTKITNAGSVERLPSWSPDGSKIVFASFRDGGNTELYVKNADGSSPTRLTNNTVLDYGPAWSPDGSKIAFTSERTGSGDIYITNADGSSGENPTRLTTATAYDNHPSWGPGDVVNQLPVVANIASNRL
jgi:Tol biopolymer transport system component